MKRFNGLAGLLGLALLLGSPLGYTAMASGGGSGGATGGGSGGRSGGVISSVQPFDDWGIPYNAMYPHGQAAFSYSADGTYKSLSIQLTSINVPDGTVMTVETVEQWITPTGNAFTISTYPVTIHQSKGLLSVSTVNGDRVMFLPPTAGQTNVYVFAPANRALMGVQLGHLGE